jgi:exodeoxyribonuclease VII large subunit
VDEKLAEAVCQMPMPVMTGIGHERDRTLLDEVACIPLDTPSKVAEHIRVTVIGAAQAADRAYGEIRAHAQLAVAHHATGITAAETTIGRGVREGLLTAERIVRGTLEDLKPDARLSLDAARDAVGQAESSTVAAARACRDAARDGLDAALKAVARLASDHLLALERQGSRALAAVIAEPPRFLDGAARDVGDEMAEVRRSAQGALDLAEREVARVLTLAEALDPRTVLAAGYAILRGSDGAPLSTVALVAAAPLVCAEMRDGSVTLRPEDPDSTTSAPSPVGNTDRKRIVQ